MFSECIFHPVSGEKGYFVTEEESKLLKALLDDFKFSQLSTLEHQIMVGDVDE